MRPVLLAFALLAWSSPARAGTPAESEPTRAIAVLLDAAGNKVGTAMLAQDLNGVRIAIGVKGLQPRVHAFNVHEVGRCDGPDFRSAGGHFNPGKKAHGPANATASHAGDLPDLVVDADGVAQVGFIAKHLSLDGGAGSLLAGAGTSLVLEVGGARVACGVVTRR